MSDLQNKFNELIEKQRAIKAEFQQTAQQLFKETTKVFFTENPTVKAIVWNQYTPYFNDGDTCEFSVNEPAFTNAEGEDLDDVSWGEYQGERDDIWAAEAWTINNGQAQGDDAYSGLNAQSCYNFSNIITSSEMQDVMLAMFEDHVTVVATAEGFNVVGYDHD
jgi:hypothetical protein